MTDVTLSWCEIGIAAQIGLGRFVRNREKGRSEMYDVDQWHGDITGAWGEFAVAALTDYCLREAGKPDRNGPDVGPLHVRTTTPKNGLRLYDNDPDTEPYVLVLAWKPPTFRVRGWIWGIDGRRDEWVCPSHFNRGGHVVPKSALRPIEDDAWKRSIDDDVSRLRRVV